MTLALWQQHVDKVSPKCYYIIENLISTYFQSEIQLSTTAKTAFKVIDEFDVIEESDSGDNVSKSTGTVACCSLKNMFKCVNCNKSLDTDADSGIVRCHHCFAKQRVSQTRITCQLNLQLETNNAVHKFVVFNDVLNTFLLKNNLTSLNNYEEDNYILNIHEVQLTHNNGSDVVLQMDVEDVQTQEEILLSKQQMCLKTQENS
ncbi:hypothetical protein ACF0H5_003692 [Mactra antiquata]